MGFLSDQRDRFRGLARQARDRVQQRTGLPDEILIHIGPPQSGDQVLHEQLSANEALLDAAGISLILPPLIQTPPFHKPFNQFYAGKTDSPPTTAFHARLRQRHWDRVLLSDPQLGRDLLPTRFESNGGLNRIERTIGMIQALGIENVKILLTPRRQDHLILAAYEHMVRRMGARARFVEWVQQQIDLEDLSWVKVVAALDGAFGQENVTIVPHETITHHGPARFYAACLAPLGLDLAKHQDLVRDDSQLTLTTHALRIALTLNKVPCRSDKEREARRALVAQIQAFLRSIEDRPFVPNNPTIIGQCKALYSAENAALAAARFPDLADGFTFEEGAALKPWQKYLLETKDKDLDLDAEF